ncbi:MAG: malonyl-ACP O-methyltransferase BioC [Flammeovirgaceae bacterium]|nr:malonyl-ACP O-methyltransferase BioC [Flammeovirgaceae bacterium]
MIEKQIVKNRFGKSTDTYHQQAKVQKKVAEKLVHLCLQLSTNKITRLLEIGCGTGFLTQKILSEFTIKEYFINDMVDPEIMLETQIKSQLSYKTVQFYPGDAESIALPTNLDTIVSASCFQWFNNLERFFSKITPLINATGILAFSTYGPENFREIKHILGTGLPYQSIEKIICLLKNDFEIFHSEEWQDALKFETPIEVLKNIKSTGVNGISNKYMGKEKLQNFHSEYLKLYANQDDTVSLTYHPIIIIARKK